VGFEQNAVEHCDLSGGGESACAADHLRDGIAGLKDRNAIQHRWAQAGYGPGADAVRRADKVQRQQRD